MTYTVNMKDFEWDKQKRLLNIEKHAIDFYDAILVFDDPSRIEAESHRKGEIRYETIGKVNEYVLFVVYTYRQPKKRIISARMASREERQLYAELKVKYHEK